jgi:hypothetical protein
MKQTSMPHAGFEPAISARKQPQTNALEHKATGIRWYNTLDYLQIKNLKYFFNPTNFPV